MGGFFAELRRRHIYRVGAGYVIVAWAITQVVDVLSQVFALPAWIGQPILVMLLVGFPVTLVVAWLIEGKSEGSEESSAVPPASRVDWVLASGLAAVLLLLGYQQFIPGTRMVRSGEILGNSIAVLPLADLSPDPDYAFFTDGIHSELLTQLSKIGSLRVISRASVAGYRDGPLNLREISEELDVATILGGDVQRVGDTVRVNVQLVNPQNDATLWAEAYDRELTVQNLLGIQREIANAIVATLQATLLPEDVARLNQIPTVNTRAYEFFLAGNEALNTRFFGGGAATAVEMYQQAVMEDPEFALAWAALCRAHINMYWLGDDTTEARITLASNAIERARELSPDLPEVHLALGDFYYYSARDYARALAEYGVAEKGMPNSPQVKEQQSYVYRRLGLWDISINTGLEAIERDPRNSILQANIGHTYRLIGNYDLANEYYQRAISYEPADILNARLSSVYLPLKRDGDIEAAATVLSTLPSSLGEATPTVPWKIALYERDYDAAIEVIGRASEEGVITETLLPAVLTTKASLYGVTYQLADREQESVQHFREALPLLEGVVQASPNDYLALIALGEALAGLGEREGAIASAHQAMALVPPADDAIVGPNLQLQAAIRVLIPAGDHATAIDLLDNYLGTTGSDWTIEGLLPDPRLDPIRDNPTFLALVEKYRR